LAKVAQEEPSVEVSSTYSLKSDPVLLVQLRLIVVGPIPLYPIKYGGA
jgi:hypothetical protein